MPESLPDQNSGVEPTDKVVDTSNTEVTDVKSSAESSTAERDGKGSILDAVKAALEPKSAEKSPDSKTEDQSDKSDDSDVDKTKEGAGEADELSEEDLSRLNRKTQKRIQSLVEAKKESAAKIAEFEPKAKQLDQVVRFISEANLSTDEVNEGFEVMRLLKNDPLKAWDRLKPIFDQLRSMVGDVLPQDLHVAVSEGQITEAHARELALTRTKAAVTTAQRERDQNRTQETQRRESFEANQTQVQSAVAAWEKSKAGSDLEWQHKQSRVMEIVRLETLQREKADPEFAWKPDEAVKFAEEALKRVNDEFKRFMPKPKAMNPVTDVAATRSEAKPQSALEAAKQGLARMAG